MINQKGSATVILLVVLVVVVAAALVYFAFLKKPAEVAVSPTPTPTKTATPTKVNNLTPTPTSDVFNSKAAKCPDVANIRPSFSFKIPTGALAKESDKCGAVDVSFGQVGQPNSALIVINPQYAKWLSLSPEYPGLSSGQILLDPKNACQKPTIGGYSNATVTFTNEKTFQIGNYSGYAADYSVNGVVNSRIACVGNISMQGYPDTNSAMQAGFNTILNSLSFSN